MSDTGSCSIEGISLESNFETMAFSNTDVVRWMARFPRFGHGSTLGDLIGGSDDSRDDYLRGIFANAIAVLVFFSLWFLAIGVFKCLGQSKVGFLSGRQAKKPGKGSTETPTGPQTLEALRVWVLFACTSIILCAIILSTRAVDNLANGLDTTRDVMSMGRDRLQQGITLIDSLTGAQAQAQLDYRNLMTRATESCSDLPALLCGDANLSVEDCILTLLPIDGDVNTVIEVLQGDPGGTFIFPEIVEIRKDLVDSRAVLQGLDDQAETYMSIFHSAIAFSIVMAVFSVTVIVAVGLAYLDKFPKILQLLMMYFILPFFSIFFILSLVLSAVFISGSFIVADFCIDSPDRHVLLLVDRFKDQLTPIMSNFILYYLQGCPVEQLPQEIADQFQYVISLLPALDQIVQSISTQALADQFCNGDGDSLATFAEASDRQLCTIAELLSDTQTLFECPSIRPLYELSVYDAICYSGTNGFSWVASTQFIIVFMAMTILMCRIVLYPTWDEDDLETSGDVRLPSPGSTTDISVGSGRSPSKVSHAGPRPPPKIFLVRPGQNDGGVEIGYSKGKRREI